MLNAAEKSLYVGQIDNRPLARETPFSALENATAVLIAEICGLEAAVSRLVGDHPATESAKLSAPMPGGLIYAVNVQSDIVRDAASRIAAMNAALHRVI